MDEEIIKANRERINHVMLDRNEKRKQAQEQRMVSKSLDIVETEQIKYFRKEFDDRKSEIDEMLANITTQKPEELLKTFEEVSKLTTLLQKFVSASTFFLKDFEVRRCQELLQNVTLKSKELEDLLIPKKKFGFKNKKVGKKIIIDEVDHVRQQAPIIYVDFCGFKHESNKKLKLEADEIFQKDITLTDLTCCTILIFGAPSTIHMSNLKECIVLCGPVFTSIFAENCESCKWVVACQQLRLHQSRNCDVYLHVTSRAIIEDCNGIRFSPYNLSYPNLKEDFRKSTLDVNINNWTSVDDFNWLAADKKSPNWYILPEEDRVQNWNHLL